MSSEPSVLELFGSNVFNDTVMKERLPKGVYKSLKKTIDQGHKIDPNIADVVANAMKDWAVFKGATHFTHIFQPLTGKTAEKHDAFLSQARDGSMMLELTGAQLIQGEPDASSFPSGGLRATFEARGYTAWDCTSPAFIKDDGNNNKTLCIPTAFCSYTGEALDKKTPLLRSMEAVSKQALRLVAVFGDTKSNRVISTVGPEQEYFLIDRKDYDNRLDLRTSGRTLFGAPSPKGQELDDQYFGSIKDKVLAFMANFDEELWKLGITSKTRHNEVAPSQFEMAPIFTTTNMAVDQNQLVMEMLQKVALRHGLVCLLHEKPFAGLNGSGKHNNWSLSTNEGINLVEPGETPHDNEQFLMVLSALIKSVDVHADLLRASAANSGNDHRLGANEAPPAIISIFMGTELTRILESIAKSGKSTTSDPDFVRLGVDSLPPLPKDNTDRNRTSPFAFTGNKFEFRMAPSSASIARCNTVLNTIVAEALDEIATRLENASDVSAESTQIVQDAMNNHGRIIFNGDGYSEEWVEEAAKRGLPNIGNTVDAVKSFTTEKSIALFEKYEVLSKSENESRVEVLLEQYAMEINIEAQTSINMVNTQYIPAVITFTKELADTVNSLKSAGADSSVQEALLSTVNESLSSAVTNLAKLKEVAKTAQETDSADTFAEAERDLVFPAMAALRIDIDALETILPKTLWPVPSYSDLLFRIN
ncbi:MAG: glutamine synthetase type III [Planctomycetota bacterium]|nr:MAG: glutamine synthetase type III [Planctomycetota bacterium]